MAGMPANWVGMQSSRNTLHLALGSCYDLPELKWSFLQRNLTGSPSVQFSSVQSLSRVRLLLYPYSRILLNNTKEWTTDVYNNMDESQKHNAEGRKSKTKGYILHDLTDMKF